MRLNARALRTGLASVLSVTPGVLVSAQSTWKDPSPHRELMIAVAPNVSVEVLDWGGRGPSVLLLGGLGSTAHIYDDFAPKLTDEFRVLALTRRGFGRSSKPSKGYDPTTLSHDIVSVLDSLKIDRIDLVAESVAGEEQTRFASDYPNRVRKLIYLEAAYDRTATTATLGVEPGPPLPPPPLDFIAMTAADSASPAAFLAAVAKRAGVKSTESDVRATAAFDSSGHLTRSSVTPAFVFDAIVSSVTRPDYSRIRAPTLAVFAVPDTMRPEHIIPWYASLDSTAQEQTRRAVGANARVAAAQRERFRREFPQAQVVEIVGAKHRIVLSNENDVLRVIRDFLRDSAQATTGAEKPVGVWRGTSTCLVRPSPCNDEIVVYRIARAKATDSVMVDARKIVNAQEQVMGVLGCHVAAGSLTCSIPNGVWHFTIRGDSLIGELRLPDNTKFRDVRAARSR